MFSSCISAPSRTALRLICATASFDFAVLIGFSQEWDTFIHCNLRSVQNPMLQTPTTKESVLRMELRPTHADARQLLWAFFSHY